MAHGSLSSFGALAACGSLHALGALRPCGSLSTRGALPTYGSLTDVGALPAFGCYPPTYTAGGAMKWACPRWAIGYGSGGFVPFRRTGASWGERGSKSVAG